MKSKPLIQYKKTLETIDIIWWWVVYVKNDKRTTTTKETDAR